jgi:hypothetical protein
MATIVRTAYQEIAPKLQQKLRITLQQPASVVICLSHEGLEDLAGSKLPPWALGLALPDKYTIGIDGSKVGIISNTLASVIRHETCHLYLGAWEKQHTRRLPLWFNEGVSEWFSEAIHFTYQEQIIESFLFDRVIPLSLLEHDFPEDTGEALQSYMQSLSVIEYINTTYGDKALLKILHSYTTAGSFSEALHKSLGVDQPALEQAWKKTITADSLLLWLWKFSTLFSLFFILALLVVIAFWRQRRRGRRVLAYWEQEELAAQRARLARQQEAASMELTPLVTFPTPLLPPLPGNKDESTSPEYDATVPDKDAVILRFPRRRRRRRPEDEDDA